VCRQDGDGHCAWRPWEADLAATQMIGMALDGNDTMGTAIGRNSWGGPCHSADGWDSDDAGHAFLMNAITPMLSVGRDECDPLQCCQLGRDTSNWKLAIDLRSKQ